MSIPATATKAGRMDPLTNFPPRYVTFESVLPKWQDAVNEKHYVTSGFIHPADQVRGSFGQKYARLDIGSSGAFMVDIVDGLIYAIKGYGKVDKTKILGNIYCPTFDAAVLVRDRFRYGRFENNPDGSLRQPIVRR